MLPNTSKVRLLPGDIVRVRVDTIVAVHGVEWASGGYFGTASGSTFERSQVIEKLDLRLIVTREPEVQNETGKEPKEVKLSLV